MRQRAGEVKPRRPRDAHLHLRHHRRPEGRDAHARQPAAQRARRGEGVPAGRPTTGRASASCRCATASSAPPATTSCCTWASRSPTPRASRRCPRTCSEVRPAHHVLGAAPLREDVRPRQREGRLRPAAASRRSSAGRSASAARCSRTPSRARSPGRLLKAKFALADKLVFSKIKDAHRRAAAAVHLGRRAARARDRRVLRRRRHAGLRGLRAHRDEPRHHLQPPRRSSSRARSACRSSTSR